MWGANLTRLRDRLHGATSARAKLSLLEAALCEVLQRGDAARFRLHPSVAHALRTFGRAPHIGTVDDVANETGWSRRRLTQLFDEQVGMTPKRYCRLIRFRHVVQRIAAGGFVRWADVAIDSGYCDQAHLAHEFRNFAGLSPGAYLEAQRPSLNHVRIG